MNLRTLFLIIIFTNKLASCREKVIFIKKFLAKIEGPDVLVARLCWKRGDYMELHRSLNEDHLRHAIIETNNFIGHNHKTKMIFLADMNCPFFYSLIEEAFKNELFKYPNKWIIFGNISELRSRNFYFPVNSYVLVAEGLSASNGTLKIQAIYKTHNDSKYYKDTIGLWSEDVNFLFYKKLAIIQNRTNFHGMALRVSYVLMDNSSLNYLTDIKHKHIDQLTKMNYLMFEKLVDIWNMTHVKLITNDWGLEFHPEKLYYKGMLGDLCYGRADVTGTVTFTPAERLKYFKYLTHTVKGLSLRFIFKAPPLAYSSNLFVLPFHRNAWIGCGIILGLCGLVIWIIVRWEIGIFRETRAIYEENEPSFLDIVMMQIGVVCQMDFFYEPRSTSGKIAIFSLLLGFSYLYTAFSARIVILLQSSTNNLNDIQALYDANMDMGVEHSAYNKFYFDMPAKRTDEKLRKLIYENKLKGKKSTNRYLTAAEGMKLVQNSRFALHIELTTASNLIRATFTDQEKCSIRTVDTIFKMDIPHISSPRNSTIAKYILIGFRRLFETGVHSRENKIRFSKLPTCTGKSSVFVSVGLIEAYFAFQVFIIGVLMSLLILALELISYVYYMKHKNKNTV